MRRVFNIYLWFVQPGGETLPVTQDNKEEYVELYVDWILNKSIEKQFNNFKRGFFKVIDADITKVTGRVDKKIFIVDFL